MGGGKAGTLLAGRPLISYPVEALRAAGLKPFVVTKGDRPVAGLPGLGEVPVVFEPDEPRHPLLGILTALKHADGMDVIVLACDLPLLPASYLKWLATEASGTAVPRVEGRFQPLAARYGADAIETVAGAVTDEGPVTALVRALDPVILDEDRLRQFGDPARMFENVNSPGDADRVEHRLES